MDFNEDGNGVEVSKPRNRNEKRLAPSVIGAQGPKGSIETKTSSTLPAQSHGRSFEDIRSDSMAPIGQVT